MKSLSGVQNKEILVSYSFSDGNVNRISQYSLESLKIFLSSLAVCASKLSYEERVRIVCEKNFQLTHREMDCYFLLVKGYRSKQIGKNLGISYRTVEKHLENIKIKLRCKTFSEVTAVISRHLYDEIY